MGSRTVVILSNDVAHEWENDATLGSQIFSAGAGSRSQFRYGTIGEMVHCDTQTLAVIDSLSFQPLTHANWFPGQDDEERNLQLLKAAADKLGYRLVRKSK